MPEADSLADIRSVADITRHNSRARPDRVAIHFEGQRTTFAELDRRANRVANGLITEGVRPRSRIAILSKNTPAFFDLWFGAAKADVVLVPVNFRLAPQEMAYVVEDAGAELLFVSPDFYPVIEKVAHDLKTVRRIIALDGAHGSWTSYADWLASQSERDLALPIAREHCAIQMYTSGTTGYPKGAQLSHANLLTLLSGALKQFGVWHDNDVNLVCMPLFHIGGSAWALVGFYCGVPTAVDARPRSGRHPPIDPGVSHYQGIHGSGAAVVPDAEPAVQDDGFFLARTDRLRGIAGAGRSCAQRAQGIRLRAGASLRTDRDDRRHHVSTARRPRRKKCNAA